MIRKLNELTQGLTTILFNLATVILAFAEMRDIVSLIPPQLETHFLVAVALANMALRWKTRTPIGEREAAAMAVPGGPRYVLAIVLVAVGAALALMVFVS